MAQDKDPQAVNLSADKHNRDNPETEFSDKMSYTDCLCLDRVLDAQHQHSDTHDEMLFIIQHQTFELWMKLAIHETKKRTVGHLRRSIPPRF